MKRNFLLPLLAACTFFATSCTQELDVPQPDQVVETNVAITRAESFYNPATGTWVHPQADPYAFDNFRAAAEKLSVAAPEPTHTVLKLLPQTEVELKTIEAAEGINLSYTPFDYASVPVTVSKDWAVEGARIVEFETSRYDGFPVLYAVWPRGTALPAGVEYEELYEVYLPTAGDEMGAVKEEAIRMALGDRYVERSLTRSADDEYLFRFTHTDDIMAGEMPLHGIRVKVGLGSSAVYGYTDAQGVVTFGSTAIDGNDEVTLIFESNYWKIVGAFGGAPIDLPLGPAMWVSLYCMHGGYSVSLDDYMPDMVCETLQALSFHYLENHGFFVYNNASLDEPSGNNRRLEAIVYSTPVSSPIIMIDTDINAPKIGIYPLTVSADTGHKLGLIWNAIARISHARIVNLFQEITHAPDKYPLVQPWIKESFASYMVWWFGEKYYQMRGYNFEYSFTDYNLTGYSMQFWDTDEYSSISTPIFIDMVDDFNQLEGYWVHFPNDDIAVDLDTTTINDISYYQFRLIQELRMIYDWEDLRPILIELVRTYKPHNYSSYLFDEMFYTYIELYDNWLPYVEQ